MHSTPLPSRRALLVSALAAAPVVAQSEQDLGPRAFFPREYECEAVVDVQRLVASDFYGASERGVVERLLLREFEDHAGVPFDALEWVHSAGVCRQVDVADGKWWVADTVIDLRGAKALSLPPLGPARGPWPRRSERIHGVDVVVEGPVEPGPLLPQTVFVAAGERDLVFGPRAAIEAALGGGHHGGVPGAELMALTAATKAAPPVAWIAMPLRRDRSFLDAFFAALPIEWFSESDPPMAVMLWLDLDAAGVEATVSARVRFASGLEGPTVFGRHVEAALKEWDPAFPLRSERDGSDLLLHVALGDGDALHRRLETWMRDWLRARILPPQVIVQPVALPRKARQ